MSDLASVWGELTDVQRAHMAELTAGKRQGNIVMAMMTNYKDMQDSLTTALNSTNSALIENEKYMESIEAKSAQFKNTVMGKWQEALNSDVIKNFVVAMTTLVEVLGNTEVIIGLLTTAFLIWKGTAITSAVKAMVTFIATTNTANASLLAMLVTTQGFTKAMQFLTATMASNPLGLLAVVATTAMVAFYGLATATKKHREEQQKQIEISQNQIQSLKQQQSGLKELSNEYESLKNKEKNLTATIEEKKRLLEIQKELVEKYNVSATGINLEGEAYSDSIEAIKLRTLALDEELKKEQELLEFKVKASDKQTNKEIKKAINLRDIAEKHIEKYQLMIDNNKGTEWYNLRQLEDWKDIYQRQQEEIYNLSKNKQKYLEYDAQETIKTLESNGKEMSDSAKLVVSEFAKSLALEPEDIETQKQSLQDFATKVANSDLDSLIEKYNKFVSAINSGDVSKQNTDGLTKTSKEIANLIDKLTKGNPYLKEFAINFASLYPPTITAKKAIDALNDSLKENSFKTASDNLKFYQETLDKLNTDGLTSELMVLARTHEKLKDETINNIEDYKRVLLEGIEKSKNEWINAEYDKFVASNDSLKKLIGNKSDFFNKINDFYGTDIKNWAEFHAEKEVITSTALGNMSQEYKSFFDSFKSLTASKENFKPGGWSDALSSFVVDNIIDPQIKKAKEGMERIEKEGQELKNQILKVFEGFGDYKPYVPTFKGSSSSSSSSKSFEKTFEVWKEVLEAINAELETLKDQLDDVNSFEQKTEIYDQMILLLEKKQNLLLEISKTFDSNLQQAENHLRSYIGKGLSESDFNKIISGSTDTIEVNIKNEKIAKAIEDFKKLKDSAEGLKKEIQGIDDEIRDLSFAEFKINLSIEDTKLSDLTQEKENLRNEMSLLEKGSAEYIVLLEQENQINIESVNILKNKIALVQQELSSDKYNADQKKELIDILKQLKQEYVNLQFSIKQQLASVADEIISIYKGIYEKQKQVALDALDEQMKAEERRHKRATDNLDDELKQFENYINAKLKALDREENEHDYQRELDKKQKERQELLDKIGLLSMDDSVEAKLQLAELNKQLAEQEDEIAEYQHDHSIDLRKENRKDQLDAYKKDINAKKKAEDTKYDLEKDRLDRIKRETERHYDDMINDERRWAKLRADIINGNIDEVKSAFSEFKNFLNSNLEFIGNSITANLITKMEQAIAVLQSYQSQSNSIPNIPDESFTGGNTTGGSSKQTGLVKPGMLLTEAAAIAGISVVYHPEDNTVTIGDLPTRFSPTGIGGTHLNAQNRIVIDEIENIKRLIKMAGGDVSKFHEGGIVGSKTSGFVDKFNKFFNTNANEHIIKAITDEILTPPKNIERYLIPNMQKLIANATPQLQFAGGGVTNVYHLNMKIGTVQGNREGGQTVFKEVVRGLKSMGK